MIYINLLSDNSIATKDVYLCYIIAVIRSPSITVLLRALQNGNLKQNILSINTQNYQA